MQCVAEPWVRVLSAACRSRKGCWVLRALGGCLGAGVLRPLRQRPPSLCLRSVARHQIRKGFGEATWAICDAAPLGLRVLLVRSLMDRLQTDHEWAKGAHDIFGVEGAINRLDNFMPTPAPDNRAKGPSVPAFPSECGYFFFGGGGEAQCLCTPPLPISFRSRSKLRCAATGGATSAAKKSVRAGLICHLAQSQILLRGAFVPALKAPGWQSLLPLLSRACSLHCSRSFLSEQQRRVAWSSMACSVPFSRPPRPPPPPPLAASPGACFPACWATRLARTACC